MFTKESDSTESKVLNTSESDTGRKIIEQLKVEQPLEIPKEYFVSFSLIQQPNLQKEN